MSEWALDYAWSASSNVLKKAQLFSMGAMHFVLSSDKRWQSLETSFEAVIAENEVKAVKKIIFVRHAESEWNVVFNRQLGLATVFRMLRILLQELLLLPTADSVLIDSPLSSVGIDQAKKLYEKVYTKLKTSQTFEEHNELLSYLLTPVPNSIVVSSNLRRTIDTARLVSGNRLSDPTEKIHVLSCLQEIGRNVDTLTIHDAYDIRPRTLSYAIPNLASGSSTFSTATVTPYSKIENDADDDIEAQKTLKDVAKQSMKQKEKILIEELFNLSESHGNKSVLQCGRERLITFAKWAFNRKEEVIIVYGHSLWFRSFCQEFFPSMISHTAKEEKIPNCGVVSFQLQETRPNGWPHYIIDPNSFQYLA
jgi:broad specificity phosphatase PhoE